MCTFFFLVNVTAMRIQFLLYFKTKYFPIHKNGDTFAGGFSFKVTHKKERLLTYIQKSNV